MSTADATARNGTRSVTVQSQQEPRWAGQRLLTAETTASITRRGQPEWPTRLAYWWPRTVDLAGLGMTGSSLPGRVGREPHLHLLAVREHVLVAVASVALLWVHQHCAGDATPVTARGAGHDCLPCGTLPEAQGHCVKHRGEQVLGKYAAKSGASASWKGWGDTLVVC
jgi:hypothetical protein